MTDPTRPTDPLADAAARMAAVVADTAQRVRADPAFGDALASLVAADYPGAADLAAAVSALLDADRDGTEPEGGA